MEATRQKSQSRTTSSSIRSDQISADYPHEPGCSYDCGLRDCGQQRGYNYLNEVNLASVAASNGQIECKHAPNGHNEMRTNVLGSFQPQPRVQFGALLATEAVGQRGRRAGHWGLGLVENVVPTCARSGLIDALQVPLVLKNKPSLRLQISIGKFAIDQPQRTLRESRLLSQSGHRYHHSSNGDSSVMQAGRQHLWPLCRQLPRRLRFYFTFPRQHSIYPAIGVAASCCTFSNFIPLSKNDQS